jgi:hypothetical protein
MENLHKNWIYLCGIVCILFVILMSVLGVWDYYKTKVYVQNGYEQVMLPGSQYYKWQKVKSK